MVSLKDEVIFGLNKQPLKLRKGQIRRIRLGFALGFTKTELAKGYGVGSKTITKVINKEAPYEL